MSAQRSRFREGFRGCVVTSGRAFVLGDVDQPRERVGLAHGPRAIRLRRAALQQPAPGRAGGPMGHVPEAGVGEVVLGRVSITGLTHDAALDRAVRTAPELEANNANYVGGDINGGIADLRQLVARPPLRWDPCATPVRGLYLCSSSTPPGGGVDGTSGYLAARSALRRKYRLDLSQQRSPVSAQRFGEYQRLLFPFSRRTSENPGSSTGERRGRAHRPSGAGGGP